jgi:hypothetical protein
MTDKLMLAAMGIFIIPLLGCHSVNKCEQSISEHPPAAVKEKIERLLPLVLEWYTLIEQQLLPQGRRLSPTEQQRARELGVQAPQEVRVVVLEAFPLPENETLCQEAIKHGYGGPDEGGRTHGYVIMLKPEFEDDSAILSHELIHVAQHDRMGREAFLRQYLIELETVGYARSPLELEAYGRQQRID